MKLFYHSTRFYLRCRAVHHRSEGYLLLVNGVNTSKYVKYMTLICSIYNTISVHSEISKCCSTWIVLSFIASISYKYTNMCLCLHLRPITAVFTMADWSYWGATPPNVLSKCDQMLCVMERWITKWLPHSHFPILLWRTISQPVCVGNVNSWTVKLYA